MGDWLELAADYFEPVCREVFDEYVKRHGFARGEAYEVGGLTYRLGDRTKVG